MSGKTIAHARRAVGDVSHFLPLAFLAPDIVESILAGRQPLELTAEQPKRVGFLHTPGRSSAKS